MIVAELRRRKPDTGEVETVARIIAPDGGGPAIMEVDDRHRLAVEETLAIGAPGPGDHVYYLDDGEAFVRLLPSAFRGHRLWAELVDEDAQSEGDG